MRAVIWFVISSTTCVCTRWAHVVERRAPWNDVLKLRLPAKSSKLTGISIASGSSGEATTWKRPTTGPGAVNGFSFNSLTTSARTSSSEGQARLGSTR
jgi:hypothetical protein